MGLIVFAVFVLLVICATWIASTSLLNNLISKKLATIVSIGMIMAVVAVSFASTYERVAEDEFGIIIKKMTGGELEPGRIIAVNGENGYQAARLNPAVYWLFDAIYDVEYHKVTEIPADKIGYINAKDGLPLPPGKIYADAWTDVNRMLTPEIFLTEGGEKGPQQTILPPGKYRIHPYLFEVEIRDVTNIPVGHVGVIKAKSGKVETPDEFGLVSKSGIGIRNEPLLSGEYKIHRGIFEVIDVSILKKKVGFLEEKEPIMTNGKQEYDAQYAAIDARTKDMFDLVINARAIYHISSMSAPKVVAATGDDENVSKLFNSSIRSSIRNIAGKNAALDFVRNREEIEQLIKVEVAQNMLQYGVTVDEVALAKIGDKPGSEGKIAELLKTQTDKEIAIRNVTTFQEQKKAAIENQKLAAERQKTIEEKKLATALYAVKISEEKKNQRIVEANASAQEQIIAAKAAAEKKNIAAKAEADKIERIGIARAGAYQGIVNAIGQSNFVNIEIFKHIAEGNIKITPNILVGEGGTLLDGFITNMMNNAMIQ